MQYRLTAYSKSSGCGCKVTKSDLNEILSGTTTGPEHFPDLLVGNSYADDAAVLKTEGGDCLISTVDFFTPMVDDAEHFGAIAACNALSDVYAMGGTPTLALAIMGWPVSELPTSLAAKVLDAASKVCAAAGIPLAGGHTIETKEPVFGLSVCGKVKEQHLKKNHGAKSGDLICLTKPIGSGLLSAAEKRGIIKEEWRKEWMKQMLRLNSEGALLGEMQEVHAMTDITGFGLCGHISQMMDASSLTAKIKRDAIPLLPGAQECAAGFIYPDITTNNLKAFQAGIKGMENLDFLLYCDPQTNGPLIFTINPDSKESVFGRLKSQGYLTTYIIGEVVARNDALIEFL
jgi:selenide,water dikinase